MGVRDRKAREKKELRQEILNAARSLFVERGYDNVSMRKIAEKVEYSPATIYLYFRDKEDLFDTLCAGMFERLVHRLTTHPSRGPGLEGMRAALRAYIDFGLDHPQDYCVTFLVEDREWHNVDKPCRRREAGCRAFSCLQELVRLNAQAGVIRVNNVEATAQMLWASIHGLTSLLITVPEFPWVDREVLVEHQIQTLLRGLQAQ
jgi:AcrR family transcriptional regulator